MVAFQPARLQRSEDRRCPTRPSMKNTRWSAARSSRASELHDFLNIGIIAPVARQGGDPMYCAATTDAPFDDEEQQSWARRYYRLKKACAPFPHPTPSAWRATDQEWKTGQPSRTSESTGSSGGRGPTVSTSAFAGTQVKISRAKLRDLVWSKTMSRAGADPGVT